MATSRTRKAQAMVELAIGMFTLALVVSALAAFFAYIYRSLEMRRSARAEAGKAALAANGDLGGYSSSIKRDKIELDSLAAEYIFGSKEAFVDIEVHMPNLKGSIQ